MGILFQVKEGKAVITDHARTIWLLNDIIEKYGEQLATKIFVVLDYMCDLSLDNPFQGLSETDKLEKIISAVCPESHINIDWNSEEMTDAVELVRDLYSTQSYRYYLTKKDLVDRALETVRYQSLDASKEFGNADQISKWDKYIQEAIKTTKEAYKMFLDEQGTIQVRGKGKQSQNKRLSDKSEELE